MKRTMEKLIITAAVVGSRPMKAVNPAVPYSPAEIAKAAIDCWRAGAAIAHIHVRDPKTGAPSSEQAYFKEVLDRIRDASDLLVNLTTSGLNITGPDAGERRLDPVVLRPDICSLDVGSFNFPDKAFISPPEWGVEAAQRMREYGVKPEIEVFDTGHIEQAAAMDREGAFAPPPYFQLCMGVRWGIAATPENLLFMRNKLPLEAQWSVLGVGRAQVPMVTMGILMGGHVRVGFEDNLFLQKGVLLESNAQMVDWVVDLARHLHREVASPQEARQILGLRD